MFNLLTNEESEALSNYFKVTPLEKGLEVILEYWESDSRTRHCSVLFFPVQVGNFMCLKQIVQLILRKKFRLRKILIPGNIYRYININGLVYATYMHIHTHIYVYTNLCI